MKAIIIRTDLRGQKVVFDADTETDTAIQFWDGTGKQMQEVSMEYYRSTKPIGDENELKEVLANYLKAFKISDTDVIVRQRLVKRSVKNRVEGENAPANDKVEAPQMITISRADFITAVNRMFDSMRPAA